MKGESIDCKESRLLYIIYFKPKPKKVKPKTKSA